MLERAVRVSWQYMAPALHLCLDTDVSLRAGDNIDSATTDRNLEEMIPQQPHNTNHASVITNTAEDGEGQAAV